MMRAARVLGGGAAGFPVGLLVTIAVVGVRAHDFRIFVRSTNAVVSVLGLPILLGTLARAGVGLMRPGRLGPAVPGAAVGISIGRGLGFLLSRTRANMKAQSAWPHSGEPGGDPDSGASPAR